MNVFNVRAYTAPVPAAPDLSFEFEYATERNGDALELECLDAAGRVRIKQGLLETEVLVSLRVLPGR